MPLISFDCCQFDTFTQHTHTAKQCMRKKGNFNYIVIQALQMEMMCSARRMRTIYMPSTHAIGKKSIHEHRIPCAYFAPLALSLTHFLYIIYYFYCSLFFFSRVSLVVFVSPLVVYCWFFCCAHSLTRSLTHSLLQSELCAFT